MSVRTTGGWAYAHGPRLGLLAGLLLVASCDDFTDPSREFGPPVEEGYRHDVIIEAPPTLGVVDSSETDVNGTPVGVGCATCHGPDPTRAWSGAPGEPFHTGVGVTDEGGVRSLDEHGHLTCDNCHTADRLRLHRADGQPIEFQDALQLCAQCHGPHYRDYLRGSHGGMSGYWDLRRGPRSRNNCVVCHAPHTPRYEPRWPAPGPQDRYLALDREEHHGE